MADQQEDLMVLSCDEPDAGKRLDVFLAGRLQGLSRAKLQKLIAAGGVRRNGLSARAKDLLAAGDRIELVQVPTQKPSTLVPIAMPLAVLYEDEHLIVINKPPGLSVHPGAGEPEPTLVHGLLAHCRALGRAKVASDSLASMAGRFAEERPGIVHRLDKDTSGAMVCAKTDVALSALAKQFHDKTNDREYCALLDGTLGQPEVLISSWLYRDPKNRMRRASMPIDPKVLPPAGARLAKSLFKTVRTYHDRITFARVRLYTGRTHQIRVHAAVLRAAVLGDPLYHSPRMLPQTFTDEVRAAVGALKRQMLHAQILGFTHPVSGERMRFEAPLPADFSHLIDLLSAHAAI